MSVVFLLSDYYPGILVYGHVMFQHDVCNFPVNENISTAYTHPLMSKTGSSEPQICQDFKCNMVSSLSLSTLMSSPVTCCHVRTSGSVREVACRPKRRASLSSEDQENIHPAIVHGMAESQPGDFDECCSGFRLPVSKKHCSKKTDSAFGRRKESVEDSDKVQAENYTSVVSRTAASSQRYTGSKNVRDSTIKFALNHSDDKLSELIGDFSRPYSLPFIENEKHRDLKAISCHTVNSDSLLFFLVALQKITFSILWDTQGANKRFGNPPQGNQEPLIVKRQGWRPQVNLG